MAKFVCSVCGYVHEDLTAPENCPVCMAPASEFSEKEELLPHSQVTNAKVKEYVCPNCGATTTNAENCEHCGSLLVRFVAKGIDISNTPYTDDTLVFPGLIEELEKNLRYQEEGKEEVYTMIKWINKSGEEDELQIDPEDTTSDSKDFDVQQIVIYLCFDRPISPKSPYYQYHKNKDAQLTKFTQLKSFPLFTSDMGEDDANVDVDNRWLYRGYYLNCGKDVKGAARLISEIMVKVKGVSPADSYGAFTRYEDDNFQDAFIEWMKAHGFDYSEYVDDDNNMPESVDSSNATNLNANNQNDADEEAILKKYQENPAALLVLVKWYVDTYHVGLKEAKDRVYFVLDKHGLRKAKSGSGCMVTILIAIISTLSAFFLL